MTDHALDSKTAATNDTGTALNLTPLARRAGIPFPTWASPGLVKLYGLSMTEPLLLERRDLGDLTWAVRLALNGLLPTRPVSVSDGTALVLEFPTFLEGESDATSMQIVVAMRQVSGGESTLHLSLPEELPAPTTPLILLVEDDEAVARCLCLFLARRGFGVVVRERGAGVVEWVHEQPPDAIVLDVDLPDMSGLELGRQLKADPHTVFVPIVFCSGNYAAREEAMRLGAADFLQKPLEVLQLPERLHALFAQRPTAKTLNSTKA